MSSEGAIVALITGVFGVLTVLIKIIADRRKQAKKTANLRLSEHPFFARMYVLKRHITTTFTLANRGKQEVFREILKAKIEITVAALQTAIPAMEKCPDNDATKLYNIHMEVLQKDMKDFQYFYRSDRYSADEQKALEIVTQKFHTWNMERMSYLAETIQMVCNSPFYADCLTKASVLFDLYLGVFIDTVNDAERTLNELNGDLAGLTFKNIKI